MARSTVLVVLALAHWHWPVHGPVLRDFRVPAERYAAGGHRGVDIAAAPGTAVRAACAGRVRFAGAVPGSGRAVSQRCGALVATYTHLASIAVRRGERLRPGGILGAVGPARHVHLGARRGSAYVDPLALLADDAAPAGPPPAPPSPRRPRAGPPAFRPPRAAHRTLPSIAWLGAALLALAVPGVTVGRAVRRRRRAGARAVAQ
jgi:hypothetical protein